MRDNTTPGNESCQTNNNSIANEHDTPSSRSQYRGGAAPRGRAAGETKGWAGMGSLRPSGDSGRTTKKDAGQLLTDGGEDLVTACPECDSPQTRPLTGSVHIGSPEHDYVCIECDHRFDDPNRRPRKREASAGPTHGGAALLDAADSFEEASALSGGRGELPTKDELRDQIRDHLEVADPGPAALRDETLAHLADALDVAVGIGWECAEKRQAIREGVDAIDADDGRELRQTDLHVIVDVLGAGDEDEGEGESAPAVATDGGRTAKREYCEACDDVRYKQYRDGEWVCDTCVAQGRADEPALATDGGVERAPGAHTPEWGPEYGDDPEVAHAMEQLRRGLTAIAEADDHVERIDAPFRFRRRHIDDSLGEPDTDPIEVVVVETIADFETVMHVPMAHIDVALAALDDNCAALQGGEQA